MILVFILTWLTLILIGAFILLVFEIPAAGLNSMISFAIEKPSSLLGFGIAMTILFSFVWVIVFIFSTYSNSPYGDNP